MFGDVFPNYPAFRMPSALGTHNSVSLLQGPLHCPFLPVTGPSPELLVLPGPPSQCRTGQFCVDSYPPSSTFAEDELEMGRGLPWTHFSLEEPWGSLSVESSHNFYPPPSSSAF